MQSDQVTELPQNFVERIRAEFGDDVFERVMDGFRATPDTFFRINSLLAGSSDPLEELRQEGLNITRSELVPGAAFVAASDREKLLFSGAHEGKRIYVQNLASMLPAEILDPGRGESVLDLTAAPGSKTLQLAEKAGPDGEIAAVEVVRKRFFKLQTNLSTHGASFVNTFLKDGTTVWRNRPEHFSYVLLDAPCASEGRFRVNDPSSFRYWSPTKGKEMARKQKRLLYSALQSVRPGGIVVYSTCSLSILENEMVVSRMLDKFGDALETEEIPVSPEERAAPFLEWKGKNVHPGVSRALRLLPSSRMEGFFICKIRKLRSTLKDRPGR